MTDVRLCLCVANINA